MTTLLIDADLLVYRSAAVGVKTSYEVWSHCGKQIILECDRMKEAKDFIKRSGGDPASVTIVKKEEDLGEQVVLEALESMISGIRAAVGRGEAVYALSDHRCHRHELAVTKPYKAGRPPKPQYYGVARDYLIRRGAVVAPNTEADDVLAYMQESLGGMDNPSVICSYDKDLLQVPGLHYNFDKRVFRQIGKEEGDRLFLLQCLTGDSTDTIPGLPGVGIKRAEAILKGVAYEDIRGAVQGAYRDSHEAGKLKTPCFKTYLIEQANLVGLMPWPGARLNEDLIWE